MFFYVILYNKQCTFDKIAPVPPFVVLYLTSNVCIPEVKDILLKLVVGKSIDAFVYGIDDV